MKLRRVLLFASCLCCSARWVGRSKRRTEKIVVWPDLRRWASDRGLWFVRGPHRFRRPHRCTALYDKSGLLVQEVSHYLIARASTTTPPTQPSR